MATITAEDRVALTDSLHRLLADKSTEADVRRTMETERGLRSGALWRQLAEMGVAGLVVDEAYGGAGAGPMELEAVMEEAGAALLCAPAAVVQRVLAAELLQALGDEAAKTRLLPGIADGSTHRHGRADRRRRRLDAGRGGGHGARRPATAGR